MKNPKTAEHAKWLRANGHNLAGLTGQDAAALAAIAMCWQLYALDRDAAAIDAVASLARRMQPKMRGLGGAVIPWALDWSDEAPLWSRVCALIDAREREEATEARETALAARARALLATDGAMTLGDALAQAARELDAPAPSTLPRTGARGLIGGGLGSPHDRDACDEDEGRE